MEVAANRKGVKAPHPCSTLLPYTFAPLVQGALPADEEASLIRIALLRCNISKLRTQDVKARGEME